MDQSKKESITAAELKAIMPFSEGRIETYAEFINMALQEFQINTMDRVAFFLSQLAHESGELRYVQEDLYYQNEAQLMAVWPLIFKTKELATPYIKNPEKLGNRIYANYLGNGDEASGDGYKFRGAGLFEVTGKENIYKCADYFGVDRQVICEWLTFPKGACMSAGWYWFDRDLNAVADKDDFELCTRKVQGGLVGFDARKEYLRRARAVLRA